MMLFRCLLVALVLPSAAAVAQAFTPPQGAPAPAERAAGRFPQPVRVGDLIGRQVLRPTEAQNVLGRVVVITRRANGGLDVIIRFGGVLGIGARAIVVPVEAVALMGEYVAVLDFTPAQLEAFATVDQAGVVPLPPDEIIRVGIVKPFH